MSDRSEAEREAARLERERRRAAGTPVPPEPEPPAAQAPVPPPEPMHAPAAPPPPVPPPGLKRLGSPSAAPGPQPGAPGMPRHPLSVPPRRRRTPGKLAALAAVVGLLVVGLLFFAFSVFTPFKGDGSGSVRVQIPAGSSTREIGDLLADKGVVASGFFFSLRAGLSGDRDKLRSGAVTLRRDMSNGAAITALVAAPAVAPTISVLVPEGLSRRQAAPIVRKEGVRGDYLAASKRSPVLNPRTYGAPKGTSTLEGFLFPATYELRRGAGVRTLVRDQLRAFQQNIRTVDFAYARRKNLTRFDVVIIASIIEREALLARDRARVAAVFYNRLKQGISLGSDATTRFAVNNWVRPLTVSELQSPSPYNTRRFRGLPPGPIGSPGLAAIKAAANPAKTADLFFIVKACGQGALSFSRTDAEFQKDVAAYKAANAKGDPKTCKG